MVYIFSDETVKIKGKNIYLYTFRDRQQRQSEIIAQLTNSILIHPHSYSSIGIITHNNKNIIIKPKTYLNVTFAYNYESMLIKMIIAQHNGTDFATFVNNMNSFHHDDCHTYTDNYKMVPGDWMKILWQISIQCPTNLTDIGMVHKNTQLNVLKAHYYKLCKQDQINQRWDKFCPADIFLFNCINDILSTKTFKEFKETIISKIENKTFYPLSIKKTMNPTLTLISPQISLNIKDKTVMFNDKELYIQHRKMMGYNYVELCDRNARYGKGKIVSNDTLTQIKYCLCLHETALQYYYVF